MTLQTQVPAQIVPLAAGKFVDPFVTRDGARRAEVSLERLDTLWFNTGTLCNLACGNCYIESSPRNDRLAYLGVADIARYLDEIRDRELGTSLIGFTGGEPFLNPEFVPMLEEALGRGLRVLVLTNAMKPMQKRKAELLALRRHHGDRLALRVSIDHYGPAVHEAERGRRSWTPTVDGFLWLARNGFPVAVACRMLSGESEAELRRGFARRFAEWGVAIDAEDSVALTIFPEMNARVDVPEITTACWGILGKSPHDVMCASSRMVIKRRGAAGPCVVACTLVPDDPQFELGATLADARRPVALNHPHCARFCVLGGAACSRS